MSYRRNEIILKTWIIETEWSVLVQTAVLSIYRVIISINSPKYSETMNHAFERVL